MVSCADPLVLREINDAIFQPQVNDLGSKIDLPLVRPEDVGTLLVRAAGLLF